MTIRLWDANSCDDVATIGRRIQRRPLAEIDAELKTVTDRILKMIGGLST